MLLGDGKKGLQGPWFAIVFWLFLSIELEDWEPKELRGPHPGSKINMKKYQARVLPTEGGCRRFDLQPELVHAMLGWLEMVCRKLSGRAYWLQRPKARDESSKAEDLYVKTARVIVGSPGDQCFLASLVNGIDPLGFEDQALSVARNYKVSRV